jgi:hypothetical protein
MATLATVALMPSWAQPGPFALTAVQGLGPPSDKIRGEPFYRFKYLPGRVHQNVPNLDGGLHC